MAWHLTGSSIDGEALMEVSVEVILQCRKIGIIICFMTNDQGSENKSVWKILVASMHTDAIGAVSKYQTEKLLSPLHTVGLRLTRL